MYWKQQDHVIGEGVEASADVQDPAYLDTLSWHGLIPDLLAGTAFENLEEACDPVETNHDNDKSNDGDVESTPANRRKHAAIETEDCDLSNANYNAVLNSSYIEPVCRLVSLCRGDVPAMFAAVIGHDRSHDAAKCDGSGPTNRDKGIFENPHFFQVCTNVSA